MEKRISLIQELRADHQQWLTKDETRYEQRFNSKFFGDLLGYEENIHRHPKASTPIWGKIADVGLGRFPDWSYSIEWVQVIVELKGSTTLLERKQASYGGQSPVDQWFGYKTSFKHCPWLIVTNFASIRLYRDNKQDFEVWTLEELASWADDWFALKKLLVLLHRKRLVSASWPSRAEELLSKFRYDQATISKKFYQEYKNLRLELINDMRVRNPDISVEVLVEKAQKLIDRTVFVHFCEDKGLLPPDKLHEVIDYGEKAMSPTFQTLTNFFEAVNRGSERLEIPHGYNGWLFQQDPVLDSLNVGDAICRKFVELGKYNFDDELSVNILGHIFEQSISDLEQLKIDLLGEEVQTDNLVETKVSKRKKDGIFYTPEYIVDYIVQNSLMTWLEEQETICLAKVGKKWWYKTELEAYQAYHQILQNVKVLDPACGSGAFLVKVFDKLLDENKRVGDMIAGLAQMQTFFDMTEMYKTILRNNIYGVDLNEESVEITKLSLWLKSAEKGKKLNNLDANIKCGNSLIDDPTVAWDKAFKREEQFPTIFQQKHLETYMITRVTHNTRVSERMVTHGVQTGEPVIMDATMECAIARHLNTIIEEEQIRVLTYNICKDHVHMLIVCSEDERDNIVKTLKGKSTHLYKKQYGITQKTNLRAQKYHRQIAKDEEARQAMWSYITDNRLKHDLPMNKGLQPLVTQCLTPLEDAYAPVYTGGFDVVVGNPPYVVIWNHDNLQNNWIRNNYKSATGKFDLYYVFIEKSISIINSWWKVWFILPNKFFHTKSAKDLREIFFNWKYVSSIIDFKDYQIFDWATTYTCLLFLDKKKNNFIKFVNALDWEYEKSFDKVDYKELQNDTWSLGDIWKTDLIKKINKQSVKLKDLVDRFWTWCQSGADSHLIFSQDDIVINKFEKDLLVPIYKWRDIRRYKKCLQNYLLFPYDFTTFSLLPEVSLERMPVFYEYLLSIKEKLDKRIRFWKSPTQLSWEWYWMMYLDNKEFFAKKHILSPCLSDIPNFCLGDGNLFVNWTAWVTSIVPINQNEDSIFWLLWYLNSSLIRFFIEQISPIFSWWYFKYSAPYLKKIPVHSNFSQIVDKIGILSKEQIKSYEVFEKKSNTLVEVISQRFDLVKSRVKLQKLYELDFSEFKKQLGIKKLSLHDEEDLMHRFTEKKQDLLALKAQIDETDYQIDEMVFDLYGLVDEERAIVRGG